MTTKQVPTKRVPVKRAVPPKSGNGAGAAAVVSKPVKYSLADLRDDVVSQLPLVSRGTAEKVILKTFAAMTAAFLAGKSVNIKDFGRIEIKHRPERQGRNPATGAAITIPAKTVPKFTFAKTLKDGAH